MKLVLNRGGTPLDHVALGVPDTERGVAEISRLTGFTPTLTEPEPNQFYWSGALPLGSGRFLEILGPNPAFRGFNPFIEIVKRLDKPRPLFWYVATNDFGAFEVAARAAGAPIERVQTVSHDIRGVPTDYTRGIIGPGFLSVSPNVIQWRSRYEGLNDGDGPDFLALELTHPEASRLNKTFETLGIDQHVAEGPHQVALKLKTPKGELKFAGKGLELRGVSAAFTMAGLFARWLVRR